MSKITLAHAAEPGTPAAAESSVFVDQADGVAKVKKPSGTVVSLEGGGGSHGSTHIQGGGDEIDGDQIDIDVNPSGYTPSTSPTEVTDLDHLGAHLQGISDALDSKIASSLLTTKGDVIVRDGSAPVRLAVGADNSILRAAAAASAGVEWVRKIEQMLTATLDLNDLGNQSGTVNLDFSARNMYELTLVGNTTLAVTANPVSAARLHIAFKQDATGGRTITFPSGWRWPGGSINSFSTSANAEHVVTLVWNGSYYRAVGVENFQVV